MPRIGMTPAKFTSCSCTEGTFYYSLTEHQISEIVKHFSIRTLWVLFYKVIFTSIHLPIMCLDLNVVCFFRDFLQIYRFYYSLLLHHSHKFINVITLRFQTFYYKFLEIVWYLENWANVCVLPANISLLINKSVNELYHITYVSNFASF